MTIEEKVIGTRLIYIANDGKVFQCRRSCEVYEKYTPLSIYDIIKDYCIIEEQDIESFKNNKPPHFSYIIVTKKIPDDKVDYCKILCPTDGVPNLTLKNQKPTLFYNDYHNAYAGGYGANGWVEKGTKKDIQNKIEEYEELLEKF